MTTHWVARYKSEPHRDVIAWDQTSGAALVLDEEAGQLQPASTLPGFAGVEAGDIGSGPIVAVLPAQGWQLAWTLEDGTEGTKPILGWAVDSGGYARPITVPDDDEWDGYAFKQDGFPVRLVPPAG